jgi:hypothetical protein
MTERLLLVEYENIIRGSATHPSLSLRAALRGSLRGFLRAFYDEAS